MNINKRNLLQIKRELVQKYGIDRIPATRDLLMNRQRPYEYPHFLKWCISPRKKYMVFRFTSPGYGIFAVGNLMLHNYIWARRFNYIPIIDIEYSKLYEEGLVGEENPWEICFEQECSTNDLSQEKFVFMNGVDQRRLSKKFCIYINGNKDDFYIHAVDDKDYYRRLNEISKNVWKLKPEIEARFNDEIQSLFDGKKRVLGVSLRENFSLEDDEVIDENYLRHPKSPKVDEILNIVENRMEKWGCDTLFIATMYQDSIELFKERFGKKVIFIERYRRHFRMFVENKKIVKQNWDALRQNNNNEVYRYSERLNSDCNRNDFTLKYVEEVYALSKCDCFIGAKSSGTIAACVWNGGKYRELEILEDKRNIEYY